VAVSGRRGSSHRAGGKAGHRTAMLTAVAKTGATAATVKILPTNSHKHFPP
jgi:hypothetical protein